MKYDPKKIEKKWQGYWAAQGTFRQYRRPKKQYVLDMFPYPSGAGLHVGHPKGYIATDVYSRFKQLQGYGVLHPMGWDAFGLPAEQYAIKNQVHPAVAVKKNIATFKKQLERIGFTYDWEREINTTDPEYYKWTQWIFLQMFKKGLAYQSFDPINWCPSCQTGLANEDLEEGRCERCNSLVEKRPMRQWVLRITAYADKMLRDLKKLDWPDGVKEAQKNWIGRSEGVEVTFYVADSEEEVCVFTTRIDTIYGCTYVVVAPEHELLKKLEERVTNYDEVKKYLEQTKKKTDLERTELNKEKTGVKLDGIEAVNPFTGEKVPVYTADYVLGSYGTGAVMAVPGHDERDFEFAKKHDLPSKSVIAPYIKLTGDFAPRKNKTTTTRECVTGIVLSENGDKVLMLRRKKDSMHVFPGGGVEAGESSEAAMMREIREETGYTDFEIIRVITPRLYGLGYKAHKDVNCFDPDTVFEIRLKSEKGEEMAEEEHQTHEVLWVEKEKVGDLPRFADHHEYMWKMFHGGKESFCNDGIVFDSGEFTGLESTEARKKMTAWLVKEKLGKKKVNYKMRDWVFSRQRYWGEPIPLIHCERCGVVPVPEKELPVRLPNVKSYEPTGTGESPLAGIASWVNVKCPKCTGPAKRETNTMPQWAGSSWYYLRFLDPHNQRALVSKQKEKQWMPVDVYVGGDHATRHLIYARFWHKFLYDQGVVSTPEPFKRLEFLGLILASDGRKMSKRWGNVINPDDVVALFGADAFRLYEMFMGPFTQSIAWNTDGVVGTRRFLEKIWKLQGKLTTNNQQPTTRDRIIESLLHKTTKKVTEDIEAFKFNTAISSLMILVNEMEKTPALPVTSYRSLLILLAPFAPHIAEELWSGLGEKKSVFLAAWPKYDPRQIREETKIIGVQVNGKVRGTIELAVDATEAEARALALADPKVQAFTEGKSIRKCIYVPGRILNFVIV
ncbi:MAG: leucine--tRNA ligase [Candidatus Moraniibacteriota bacterium]|nr:MAG: leucine--tRNA ligase [Candidatus Moranbacteria bacterium]